MGHSILVVDEEKDMLESMRRGLFLSGHTNVCLISDPSLAARMVESGEFYDVAILDITMPEMSRVDLVESIKALSPATACILITQVTEVETAQEYLDRGVCDYLVRPFSMEDLSSCIKKALGKKRAVEKAAHGS
ncbi:MAG: response regulator [Syntrophobacteraceae bacterium]